jgi:hypothetical protein
MKDCEKLKTSNSNEKGLEWITLQCAEVLESFKSTNAHPNHNVLKRQQSFIDRKLVTLISSHSPSHKSNELNGLSLVVASSNPIPMTTSIEMEGLIATIGKPIFLFIQGP